MSSGTQRATVLVVDDEDLMRRLVSRALTGAGYAIAEASDGAEALAVLCHGASVNLVLTDVQMPRMNGIELVRSLRRDHPGIPAIYMTGYPAQELEGCETVLHKPFTPDVLKRAVARALAVKPAQKTAGILTISGGGLSALSDAVLALKGYSVFHALEGIPSALRLLREKGDEIKVVLLDLEAPSLPDQYIDELLSGMERRPDLQVVVCSSFSEDEVIAWLPGANTAAFLQTPCTAEQLLDTVQQALSVAL